jgi:hypothetical protein
MSTVLETVYTKHAVGLASLIALMKKARNTVEEACVADGDGEGFRVDEAFRDWYSHFMQLHGLTGSLKMLSEAINESDDPEAKKIADLFDGLHETAEEAIRFGGNEVIAILRREPVSESHDDQHD